MDIKICINGKIGYVNKKEYIIAKTSQLREFGYSNLTEKEVEKQLEKIYLGKELSVIGMIIKDDIILEEI